MNSLGIWLNWKTENAQSYIQNHLSMPVKPRNKNLGKHPLDPEYDDDFNYDEELYRYEMEIEMEEDDRRGERNRNNQ